MFVTEKEQNSIIQHKEMLRYFQSIVSERQSYEGLSRDKLLDFLYDTFYYSFEEISEKYHADFWDYLRGDELKCEKYREIRRIFLNKELKIKTKELFGDEIIHKTIQELVRKILFFEIKLADEEKWFVINTMEEILNAETRKKYYQAPSENEYADDYKEILKFKGIAKIEKAQELRYRYKYSEGYNGLEGKAIETPWIDYDKMLTSIFKNVLLISDNELRDEFVSSEVISNVISIPTSYSGGNYSITFDYNNAMCSYGFEGDVCIEVDVTTYPGNEMWELYMAEAYRNYNLNNYRTAFLLGFISFEALIETIISYLKERLMTFIKELNHDLKHLDEEALLQEVFPEIDTFDFEPNLKWYIKLYTEFCNERRDLINDKLKDLLKFHRQLIFCSDGTISEVENFSEVFGDNYTIEALIIKKMNEMVEIRNNLAHGSANNNEADDYKYFFEVLVISLAQLISYFKGQNFLEKITDYDKLFNT